ncbi:hypothetical protein LTR97_000995 [Elasticomyces elasticus]|uniref:C2H2-type domain-containing protein n=1 Tax=Elasticomyces elasticus TaxID=574655 RepID=A0AAN7ZWN8_9PEZI|nr:hypothetical protein LTR97_000995 [Elasticomyces elasticus]
MADVIEQPLQESTAMSLTAALSELSVASHDAMQHPIQDSTGQPIQPENAEMNGTQSTDNINEPLAETHTAPPAVVFKCAPCNLHFNNEKRLKNHIRYSPAHSTGSGGATTKSPHLGAQTQVPPFHYTAFKGVDRKSTSGQATRPGNPKTAASFDMRPALHDDVSRLLKAYGLSFRFFPIDNSQTSLQEYDTHIMGIYTCTNSACSRTWKSGLAAITIRKYPKNQYNARVYHQRCVNCRSVCRPELDSSYAERVSYRLAVWSGVAVQAPPYTERLTKPHEEELCEGCKAGHCIQAKLLQRFGGLGIS